MNNLTPDQVTQLITYGGGFLIAAMTLVAYIGRSIADTRRKDRESKVEIDRKKAETDFLKVQADALIKTADANAEAAVKTANAAVIAAGAERERLTAEASRELAQAVAKQLENLGNEVRRLSEKLQTTEDKLNEANRKLDELGDQLRNQNTESKRIADNLLERITDLRAGLEAIKKYGDGTEIDSDLALKRDDASKEENK